MDMNREPRENFGFWASEDYALTADTKGGRRKKKSKSGASRRTKIGTDYAVNKGLSALSKASRSMDALDSDMCECTIV